MDGGELFSRIQDRGDQAFTERGEEYAHARAVTTSVSHRRLSWSVNQNLLKRRENEDSRCRLSIAQFLFIYLSINFKAVGRKWPDPLLAKATVQVFTSFLKDLFSLCRRGLRHHEEHRGGHRIFTRRQHCTPRCQGLALHLCVGKPPAECACENRKCS